MKKLLKIFGTFILVCIFILAFFIICPQILFKYKIEYRNFVIYSTEEFDSKIYTILDSVISNLRTSPLFNKNLEQKVFICNDPLIYTLLCYPSRSTFGGNWELWGNIFIANANVEQNISYRKMDNRTRSLVNLITHETTHTLIENSLGFKKYSDLPTWKNEGYCDYIAKGGTLRADEGIHTLCSDKNLKNYYVYMLAVKHLIDDKAITTIDFFKNNFDYNEVIKILKKRYCSKAQISDTES